MESPDLNPSPAPDDAADTWLRANHSLPPLPDAGFSRRVLAALPPARRRFSRTRFCLAGLAAGLVVALAGLAWGGVPSLATLDSELTESTGRLLTSPALGALGVAAISVWYALCGGRRLLPRL